jgi:cytochrome o ubiquinol oxidase subunit 3
LIFIRSVKNNFSGLFAAYAALSEETARGPTGRELFELHSVFIETACLLFSSYTCGLGALSAERNRLGLFYLYAALTFALGAVFLFIEITEFAGMVGRGAGPSRSAFLSAFFTLVGTHGAQAGFSGSVIWWRRYPPRACGRPFSGVCFASAYSGMRWTLFGSAC